MVISSLDVSAKRPAVALLVSVLLLRSRILRAPQDAVKTLKKVATSRHASPEEVEQALRTGYIEDKDGGRTLLVPQGGRVAKVSGIGLGSLLDVTHAHGQCTVGQTRADITAATQPRCETLPTHPCISQTFPRPCLLPTIGCSPPSCVPIMDEQGDSSCRPAFLLPHPPYCAEYRGRSA
jgi:hypothetical protein